MNDQELTANLIELEIGKRLGLDAVAFPDDNHWIGMNRFVRDPRVAMAIMKRVADEGFHISIGAAVAGGYDCHMDHIENDMRRYSADSESLSRAINEAGVKVFKK